MISLKFNDNGYRHNYQFKANVLIIIISKFKNKQERKQNKKTFLKNTKLWQTRRATQRTVLVDFQLCSVSITFVRIQMPCPQFDRW